MRGQAPQRTQRRLFALPMIAIFTFSVPEAFIHTKPDTRSLKFMSFATLTVCRFSWVEKYVRLGIIFLLNACVVHVLNVLQQVVFTLVTDLLHTRRDTLGVHTTSRRLLACPLRTTTFFAHFSIAWSPFRLFVSADQRCG